MKMTASRAVLGAAFTALSFASANAQDPASPAQAAAPTTEQAPAAAPTPAATPEAAPVATAPAAMAAPAAAPAPACELHVFPTVEGQAMTTGWLAGFGIVGAVADASMNKDRNINEAQYLKEALGPRLQVQALKSIDLVGNLKLQPSQIIYETPISDRSVTTKANARLSSSTAPCYVELIITQNFYRKAAIYGRSLNNRFIFKDFRGGKTSAELVKGRGGNGLSAFPPKTTDETDAAEQDLREAFAKNFVEFAKGVHPAQ
jgi:hypothetical protein